MLEFPSVRAPPNQIALITGFINAIWPNLYLVSNRVNK